jgi:hypothetical protein
MTFSGAEPAADQEATGVAGSGLVAQLSESVLDRGLAAAGRGHRVPTGHARPERFDRPPVGHRAIVQGAVHATPSPREPILIKVEYGLVRARSRTSSTTRRRKAV